MMFEVEKFSPIVDEHEPFVNTIGLDLVLFLGGGGPFPSKVGGGLGTLNSVGIS